MPLTHIQYSDLDKILWCAMIYIYVCDILNYSYEIFEVSDSPCLKCLRCEMEPVECRAVIRVILLNGAHHRRHFNKWKKLIVIMTSHVTIENVGNVNLSTLIYFISTKISWLRPFKHKMTNYNFTPLTWLASNACKSGITISSEL